MTASTLSPPPTLEPAPDHAHNIEAGTYAAHTISSVSFASNTNFHAKRKRLDNKKMKSPPPTPSTSSNPITCRYRRRRHPTTHVIADCLNRRSVEGPQAYEAKLEKHRARRVALGHRSKLKTSKQGNRSHRDTSH